MARLTKSSSNPVFLAAALEGLEIQKQRIARQLKEVEEQIRDVKKQLGRKGAVATPITNPVSAKRRLSPEARKRIAAAQKKRWAAYRKVAAPAEK